MVTPPMNASTQLPTAEHKIVLFVLPSHCTHALQPLDVLFSPLKQSWAAAVTEHEFNGKSVTKDNFIKVYSSAHLHAFTKANILAAFRKTGIYPFNPLVIMKAQIVRVCPRLGVYWCRRENGSICIPPMGTCFVHWNKFLLSQDEKPIIGRFFAGKSNILLFR